MPLFYMNFYMAKKMAIFCGHVSFIWRILDILLFYMEIPNGQKNGQKALHKISVTLRRLFWEKGIFCEGGEFWKIKKKKWRMKRCEVWKGEAARIERFFWLVWKMWLFSHSIWLWVWNVRLVLVCCRANCTCSIRTRKVGIRFFIKTSGLPSVEGLVLMFCKKFESLY